MKKWVVLLSAFAAIATPPITTAPASTDDNHAHFEIKDDKYEYEFEIDAITGKILDFEKDRDDN